MNRMNKPLTLKMLAKLAAGLAVLYVVFLTAMNWKLAAGVLQGTYTLSHAMRHAETYLGGFIFLVVIACMVVPMFFGGRSTGQSNADDDFPHRRDTGLHINPGSGLPMQPGSSFDVAGNPYGFDNNQH